MSNNISDDMFLPSQETLDLDEETDFRDFVKSISSTSERKLDAKKKRFEKSRLSILPVKKNSGKKIKVDKKKLCQSGITRRIF